LSAASSPGAAQTGAGMPATEQHSKAAADRRRSEKEEVFGLTDGFFIV
jgi:hypothetical protein